MFKRKIFQIQDETVIAKSKNYYKRKNFTASIATKVIEVKNYTIEQIMDTHNSRNILCKIKYLFNHTKM